ncbi:hypothetical protein [Maribacter sp. 2307UL18-2]|uniref:hypothetical protein n=1 Tax=Maribacter sp. 2307UL18-2 TaxID=3386274 RepID=UPI0039BCBDBA
MRKSYRQYSIIFLLFFIGGAIGLTQTDTTKVIAPILLNKETVWGIVLQQVKL